MTRITGAMQQIQMTRAKRRRGMRVSEAAWWRHLKGDPLPFLLADEEPGVVWRTLQALLSRPADAPAVQRARLGARKHGEAALAARRPVGVREPGARPPPTPPAGVARRGTWWRSRRSAPIPRTRERPCRRGAPRGAAAPLRGFRHHPPHAALAVLHRPGVRGAGAARVRPPPAGAGGDRLARHAHRRLGVQRGTAPPGRRVRGDPGGGAAPGLAEHAPAERERLAGLARWPAGTCWSAGSSCRERHPGAGWCSPTRAWTGRTCSRRWCRSPAWGGRRPPAVLAGCSRCWRGRTARGAGRSRSRPRSASGPEQPGRWVTLKALVVLSAFGEALRPARGGER